MKVRSVTRNWWPIVLSLAVVIAAQAIIQSSVVANGAHASDHVQSATAPYSTFFLVTVIMWAAPDARRRVDVWVVVGLLAVASLVVMLGNLQVVNAIAGDSWNDAQANALGPARPGFESGHSMVALGEMAMAATLVLLIVVLRVHEIIRSGPAIGATGLTLLALALPGLGPIAALALLVLAVDVCAQRARRIRDPSVSEPQSRQMSPERAPPPSI
jgi:hypothetical protein